MATHHFAAKAYIYAHSFDCLPLSRILQANCNHTLQDLIGHVLGFEKELIEGLA